MKYFKIVFLGEEDVGKTSLIIRTATNTFEEDAYIPTIYDNCQIQRTFNDISLNIGLWDTPGASVYDRLRPLSFPGTNLFVLCFNLHEINRIKTLKEKFLKEIDSTLPNGNYDIVVWGTKFDLIPRKKPMIQWINQTKDKPRNPMSDFMTVAKNSLQQILPKFSSSSSSSSSPRNKSSTSAHIYKLPDELLAYIAKFCFLEDVNHCCAVSWRWYQCLASDIVWEQLFFRETNQIDDPKIAKKDDLEPIINRYYSEIKKRIKFKNSMLKHNRIRPAMFIYFTRGLQTAQDIGASLYLESSSKTRENFDECWNAILELMVRNN